MNVFKEEPRTLTILKVVRDLSRERLTMGQMVQRYSVNKRTIYRYLKYLEEADYCIDKDFYNRFFIHDTTEQPRITAPCEQVAQCSCRD